MGGEGGVFHASTLLHAQLHDGSNLPGSGTRLKLSQPGAVWRYPATNEILYSAAALHVSYLTKTALSEHAHRHGDTETHKRRRHKRHRDT